jgi:hypothetical protein
MTDFKDGDRVRIVGPAGARWEGRAAYILKVLPKGEIAECRVAGDTPRHGEVYPAFPIAWLRLEPEPELTEEQRRAAEVYDAAYNAEPSPDHSVKRLAGLVAVLRAEANP